MTIVLLTSLSLYALLVTSRPVHFDAAGLSELSPISSTVQAAFHVHPGKDDVDAPRFHSQNPKQQVEYISELNAKDIIAPSFEISQARVKASFQVLSGNTADKNNVFGTNNGLDDSLTGHVADKKAVMDLAVDEQREVSVNELPASTLVVLAFSCIAAFLALACIALTLYIIKSLRAQILASKTAWELLPRFWGSREDTCTATKNHFCARSCLLQADVGQRRLVYAEEGPAESHDFRMENTPFDAASDIDSELDDIDEKYQDALDMTPLPITHDLPPEEHASHQARFDDPPLPSLGSYPLDQRIDDRSPRIRGSGSSPATRPAWSVRAVDTPPLGLSSSKLRDAKSTLQPPIHSHRRAYRSADPELDVALAMQLRPGIGIGADSAWMVRFLMAIFGWFTVALTSNAR